MDSEKLSVIKIIGIITDMLWSSPAYHMGGCLYKIWCLVITIEHRWSYAHFIQKCARFTSLLAFLNFAKKNLYPDFTNPCNSPMLRKLFRVKVKTHWDILEKDTVDEIIFRTTKLRDRLLLELMARGAMRIG